MKAHRILCIAISLCCALPCLAQATTATCTFSYFTPPAPYNAAFEAYGINHYGTVVGRASSTTLVKAFIKPASGSPYLYAVPGATYTVLNKRNYYGTSVGFYAGSAGSTGLILTSSSRASLSYPHAYSTVLNGINRSNSIVGSYISTYGANQQGFKYSGGRFQSIKFPGAVQTIPVSINDNGVIVGQYTNGNLENAPHGFIYQGGNYKTVDIPGTTTSTQLLDINNSGEIVGSPNLLYKSGTWKRVVAPNSAETFVYGINDLGHITGVANYSSGGSTYTWKAYTATCQ